MNDAGIVAQRLRTPDSGINQSLPGCAAKGGHFALLAPLTVGAFIARRWPRTGCRVVGGSQATPEVSIVTVAGVATAGPARCNRRRPTRRAKTDHGTSESTANTSPT